MPKKLPPDPAIQYDDELLELLEKARGALGRLDGSASVLPNPDLFLYMYVRKDCK